MKHSQIIGAIFTLIIGTLLHFTYAWSGESAVVGAFSATNESTWEHLKLLVMPMIIFAIAEYFIYGKQIQNFISIKTLSILLGMCTIVVTFYTYVGIVGQHFLWADIATFAIGVIVAYFFSARLLNSNYFSSAYSIRLGWLGIIIIFVLFVVFTFFPPHIALFLDPVLNRYGR